MSKEILLTVILLSGTLFFSLLATVALILGILSYIKVVAMEKSTHTVQMMPAEEIQAWGMNDKEVETVNKINKNDVDLNFDNLSI